MIISQRNSWLLTRRVVLLCLWGTLFLTTVRLMAGAEGDSGSELKIWFTAPASNWESEALPLGNGRLGCMVFGSVSDERIQLNEDSLWTGDENPSGQYESMGAYQDLGTLRLMLPRDAESQVPTIRCDSGHSAFYPYEEVVSASDGDPGTKWCVEHHDRPVVGTMAVAPAAARLVDSYCLTSANDVPSRDPRSWVLDGSMDGETWVELDRRSDEPTFENRGQQRTYEITKPGSYTHYRFTFSQVHGETRFQLAEIALQGLPTKAPAPQSYRRQLDLANAVQRVSYVTDGVTWTREYFCSHPAQVIVVRLTADRHAAYSGKLSLQDAHQAPTTVSGDRLTASGELANGLKYETQARVVNQGGTLRCVGSEIEFSECDSLTILLAAGTDYRMDASQAWRGTDPHARVTASVDEATATDFAQLKRAHVEDYQSLFGRLSLSLLPQADDGATLPTDQRLSRYRDGQADPGLAALLFQYGRYLLISSTRPGSLPANLQGLWNNSNDPPWHCDYHSNINLQMNYWLAEPANLAECQQPLLDLIWAMREPSRRATQAEFGNVRGWTARTSHNIFGGHGWKWNVPSSAWYAQHFYEHFAFGLDEKYLREQAYPMLKEICEFWEDQLKSLPDGTLVVPNGWSPEHGPVEDGWRSRPADCVGSADQHHRVGAKPG